VIFQSMIFQSMIFQSRMFQINYGGVVACLALLGSLGACSFEYHARSPEDYRAATRALLESKQSDFTNCYAGVIKATPDAKGSVAVSFVVEEKTGKILTPKSLPESTAPAPLQECVVNGLNGLALQPPDQRKGVATMTFDFDRG
jgi:hypothetical protein